MLNFFSCTAIDVHRVVVDAHHVIDNAHFVVCPSMVSTTPTLALFCKLEFHWRWKVNGCKVSTKTFAFQVCSFFSQTFVFFVQFFFILLY